MLFGAARVLRAGQARCPAGKCGDGGVNPALPHMLQLNSAARGEPCAWHSCSLRPRQRTALHVTHITQAVIGTNFPGCSGQAAWWLSTVLPQDFSWPLPSLIAPPAFCQTPMHLLASRSPLLRTTQSPAPHHCPLTQPEPFLGSSTTQMSKTGKISPPRVLYWPAVGINHRLLHDFPAPTAYIISQ